MTIEELIKAAEKSTKAREAYRRAARAAKSAQTEYDRAMEEYLNEDPV